eukprot:765109-Hanusia_phi.AAC.5
MQWRLGGYPLDVPMQDWSWCGSRLGWVGCIGFFKGRANKRVRRDGSGWEGDCCDSRDHPVHPADFFGVYWVGSDCTNNEGHYYSKGWSDGGVAIKDQEVGY